MHRHLETGSKDSTQYLVWVRFPQYFTTCALSWSFGLLISSTAIILYEPYICSWTVPYSLNKGNNVLLCFFMHKNISCDSGSMEIIVLHNIWKFTCNLTSAVLQNKSFSRLLYVFLSSLIWSQTPCNKTVVSDKYSSLKGKLWPLWYSSQHFYHPLNKQVVSLPQGMPMHSAVVSIFIYLLNELAW